MELAQPTAGCQRPSGLDPLRSLKNLADWSFTGIMNHRGSIMDVGDWLRGLRLGQYEMLLRWVRANGSRSAPVVLAEVHTTNLTLKPRKTYRQSDAHSNNRVLGSREFPRG